MRLTNEILKEAISLEQMIKDASKRLNEIREAAKSQGSFSTRHFIVSVTEQEREALAGKNDFFAFYDRLELEKKGLIKTTKYQIVKIQIKLAA